MAPEEMNSLIICLANFLLQIKAMKDMYLPEISEMYQKIDAKLQQVCYTFKFPFAIHRLSLFDIQPFPSYLWLKLVSAVHMWLLIHLCLETPSSPYTKFFQKLWMLFFPHLPRVAL